jgi:type I restriction enzyme, S subunit
VTENWEATEIGERFSVNPQRQLLRGTVTPFVPMDALPTNAREIERVEEREFKGSGQKFRNGDTLVARITPCLENGKTAFVKALKDGAIGHGSTEYIVLSGVEGVSDSLFAYYLARTPKFRAYAIARMEGTSGRQRVPASAVSAYEIDLPPLPEQKAIASVLGALDDKVENNRRMNETLEEMARAIFKSWFVDFDPIRVKAEGKQPAHMDAETAALFPSSYGDDGLPVGWRQQNVSDLFDFTMGQSPPGRTYNEDKEGLPFWQGRRDFGFRFPSNRVYCTAPTRFADSGDTLVSVRAPVGDVNRALERCCVGRGVAALMHKSKLAAYTYYTALQLRAQFKIHEASGTVFGSINKKQFGELKIVSSEGSVEDVFDGIASALDDKILNNHLESETLSTLRDTLLPKLMSGEIRVRDAEQEVEAVA